LKELFALVYAEIMQGNIQFALYGGASADVNPIVTRIVGDIGIVAYALLLLVGFLYVSFRQNKFSLAGIIPYAFGGAVVFAMNFLIFSLGVPFARDILARGFLFTYLVGAPLAVFVLRSGFQDAPRLVRELTLRGLTRRKPSSDDHRKREQVHLRHMAFRASLTCLALLLILLPSMYYFYPAARYDNSAPMIVEDYRLPLEQWRAVATWASSYVGPTDLHGDDLAFSFIGGIGHKVVHRFPAQIKLLDWVNSRYLAGAIIVFRMSTVEVHYPLHAISAQQLEATISRNNIVYSGGDPVIVIRPEGS
jgi:hypothetical protein